MTENQESQTRKIASVSTATILKVVGVFLALYFLYLVRDIILLLVIAFILSSALMPLVDWLYSRVRFPRGLTVVLVYILVIGVVALVFSFVVPRLISEFVDLGRNIDTFRAKFETEGPGFYEIFRQFGLFESLESLSKALAGLTSEILQKTFGVVVGFFRVIAVLVISFYLVIHQNAMKDFVKSVTPLEYHERIGAVVYKVQRKLGRWLIGQLSLMAIIFLLTFIGLSILRVKYALALGLLAGVLEILPYLGPFVSAAPAVFVAFLQSPLLALIVIGLYTFIQQTENYFLTPRIIGKSIGTNPLVVLIVLLIGLKVAGFVGMLIAAPLVAIGTVILQDYSEHRKAVTEI